MLTNENDPKVQAACDLLSIDPAMNLDQAKRCYLRAIKQCRPERDPEGFRLRRQAWEYLQPFYYRAQWLAEQAAADEPIAAYEPEAPVPIEAGPTPSQPEPVSAPEAPPEGGEGRFIDLEKIWESSQSGHDPELIRIVAYVLSGDFPFNEINFDSLLNCAIWSRLDSSGQWESVQDLLDQVATRYRREIQSLEFSYKKFMLVGDFLRDYQNWRIYWFIGTELLAYRAGPDNTQANQAKRPGNFGQGELESLANGSPSLHAYAMGRLQFYRETKGWNLVEAKAEPAHRGAKPAWGGLIGSRILWIVLAGFVLASVRLCTDNASQPPYKKEFTREQMEKLMQKIQSETRMPNSYPTIPESKTKGAGNE